MDDAKRLATANATLAVMRAIERAMDTATEKKSAETQADDALKMMRLSDPRLARVTTLVRDWWHTWRLQGAPTTLAFLDTASDRWIIESRGEAHVVATGVEWCAVLLPAASCVEFGTGVECFTLYQLSTYRRAPDEPSCED